MNIPSSYITHAIIFGTHNPITSHPVPSDSVQFNPIRPSAEPVRPDPD